ncbi:hypothetical protein Tco_0308228 [Tanacetum coccineum]
MSIQDMEDLKQRYLDEMKTLINEKDYRNEKIDMRLENYEATLILRKKTFHLVGEIVSFSPSPIPVEGSDSFMEEIDIFLAPDDSIPPGIENDDYDFEGDILFLEELLSNDSP